MSLFTDEGVYVNNSGSLVKHAVMQWGETPYAVGKTILAYPNSKIILEENAFSLAEMYQTA